MRRRDIVNELDGKDYASILHPEKSSTKDKLKLIIEPLKAYKGFKSDFIIYALTDGLIPIVAAFSLGILTYIVQRILNANFDQSRSVLYILGVSLALFTIFLLCQIVSIRKFHKNRTRFMRLRMMHFKAMTKKMGQMELGLFEDAKFIASLGDFSRLLQSSETGLEGIYTRGFQMGGNIVSTIILALVLLFVHPLIVPILIVCGFLHYYLGKKEAQKKKETVTERVEFAKRLDRYQQISSDFRYGKDIRVFDMDGPFETFFDRLLGDYRKSLNRRYRSESLYTLPDTILLAIMNIACLGFIGQSYLAGHISIPWLMSSISFLFLCCQQFYLTLDHFIFMQDEFQYFDDFIDVMKADIFSDGGEDLDSLGDHTVEFKNVSFKYPHSDTWVLKNLNLTIPHCSTLALVGLNGQGKTTLVNLLTGLYMPQKGSITIGGVDIRDISKKSLRDTFAVVLQDVNIMAMTVGENIALSEQYDANKVWQVLDQAGLKDKIASFDKGLDTPLLKVIEPDGKILSGGENQKLGLARALYHGGQMMVLDEPTSALDALAEEKIYQEFADMTKGKTALFISHRLASTRFCDQIALLQDGAIQEVGTHAELLTKKGLYWDIYETQASYYKEEGEDYV